MKFIQLLTSFSLLLLTFNVQASIIPFSSDFDSAIDTGSGIRDGGYSLQQGLGDLSLSEGALQFNLDSSFYESTSIDMPNYTKYHIEFDILTRDLTDSNQIFRLSFQPFSLRFIDSSLYLYRDSDPDLESVIDKVGDFTNGVSKHLELDFDLTTNQLDIEFGDINYSYDGNFTFLDSLHGAHFQLRYYGTSSWDPSVSVELDNLHVTAENLIPEPSTLLLFLTSALFLTKRRRFKS